MDRKTFDSIVDAAIGNIPCASEGDPRNYEEKRYQVEAHFEGTYASSTGHLHPEYFHRDYRVWKEEDAEKIASRLKKAGLESSVWPVGKTNTDHHLGDSFFGIR
jgi:hypothetical protein